MHFDWCWFFCIPWSCILVFDMWFMFRFSSALNNFWLGLSGLAMHSVPVYIRRYVVLLKTLMYVYTLFDCFNLKCYLLPSYVKFSTGTPVSQDWSYNRSSLVFPLHFLKGGNKRWSPWEVISPNFNLSVCHRAALPTYLAEVLCPVHQGMAASLLQFFLI